MDQHEDLPCSVQHLQANAGTVPSLRYNHLLPHFFPIQAFKHYQFFLQIGNLLGGPCSHVFIQLIAALKRSGLKHLVPRLCVNVRS